MAVKAIFFDVDGTIYSNRTNRFIPSTIEAIHRMQDNGILCFVASGRHPTEIVPEIHAIGFDGIIMADGLSATYHGEMIVHHTIAADDLRVLIDLLNQGQYQGSYAYQDSINAFHRPPSDSECRWLDSMGIPWIHRPLQADDVITKVSMFERLKAPLPAGLHLTQLYDDYFDIRPIGISKASAIQSLLDYLHIGVEEAACFGDSRNDIEMFQLIPNNYCMGNGFEGLKQMAAHVIGDIDEDAIFEACQENGWC